MNATLAARFAADRACIAQIQRFLDEQEPELEGEAYLTRAHELMERHGFKYTGAPCSCLGNSDTGHAFFCGYTRSAAA